jgi:nucleoside-diphosphate-sugar epimerase
MKILVAGAGGAIGGHLVKALLNQGHEVRAVDIKPKSEWWQIHPHAHNWGNSDLARPHVAEQCVADAEQVYDLAERMGGIGYITTNRVECAESIEIGINLLRAAHAFHVKRFFFASSACVYPTDMQGYQETQGLTMIPKLREDDAWPAQPEEGYGFAKLYMEELCRHYAEERDLEVRIARYHNVYGPYSSWNDGKEKSPAAICRKVAEAVVSGIHNIEIWGDGRQVRSYLHVSDCVAGTMALMASDHSEPINIGSDRAITVNELVALVEEIAEVKLGRFYDHNGPRGVAGRNADIRLAARVLDWKPEISLEQGLASLYGWIAAEVISNAASDVRTESPGPTISEPV